MTQAWYSAAELAGLPEMPASSSGVIRKAKRDNWASREREAQGGGREYQFSSLPEATRAALISREAATEQATTEPPIADDLVTHQASGFSYSPSAIWEHAATKTEKQREVAREKVAVFATMQRLMDEMGWTQERALKAAAEDARWSFATLRDIWHGRPGSPGLKLYQRADWAAALVPGHTGGSTRAAFDERAKDWFLANWLTRRQPAVKETYRRMCEVARAEGWEVPSERSVNRWVDGISFETKVLKREGAEALNRHMLKQRRDKRVFHAGEAVSGDGLKFDKLWVKFPDGEIINTTTAWVWQDIYSGKLLAHRVDKTENTDLFRLATYDLTAICVPSYAWVDNTMVAANKAMTAGAEGRKRFKDHPDDQLGLLLQLGIDPRFTCPDHTVSNPGVKPIERSFGIGGLHELVATAPEFVDRGYSKTTAIPLDDFRSVLAREVERFNARDNRRTQVCGGVKSFNQAFEESFSRSLIRRASEAQRRLLLMMPEVVSCQRLSGEIQLTAGAGPLGKPRYHSDTVAKYRGHKVVAYYDPADLQRDVTVYTLDGRLIGTASRVADNAFNDTAASREWRKNKVRKQKAVKAQAAAEQRMSQLEQVALYPNTPPVPPAEPGVIRGNFKQKRRVMSDGTIVDTTTGQILTESAEELAQMQRNFQAGVTALAKRRLSEI